MNITVVLLQYAIPLISTFEVIFYFFSRRRSGRGGLSFSKWLRAFLLQKELNQEVRTVELFLKEALRDCIEKMTPRGTSNVLLFSQFSGCGSLSDINPSLVVRDVSYLSRL